MSYLFAFYHNNKKKRTTEKRGNYSYGNLNLQNMLRDKITQNQKSGTSDCRQK